MSLSACGTTTSAGSVGSADVQVAIDIVKSDAGEIADTGVPVDVTALPDTATPDASPDVPDGAADVPDDVAADVATQVCGDGKCTSPETTATCPGDCAAPVCGDGFCQKPESGITCEVDCSILARGQLACLTSACGAAVQGCLGDKACAKVLGSALQCMAQTGADPEFCGALLLKDPYGKAVLVAPCTFVACGSATGGTICGDGICQASETTSSCLYDCFTAGQP